MVKEFGSNRGDWHTEGWVSLNIRDFGLGLVFHGVWKKQNKAFGVDLTILFFEFHFETWKWLA
jgi:hypothetical protein